MKRFTCVLRNKYHRIPRFWPLIVSLIIFGIGCLFIFSFLTITRSALAASSNLQSEAGIFNPIQGYPSGWSPGTGSQAGRAPTNSFLNFNQARTTPRINPFLQLSATASSISQGEGEPTGTAEPVQNAVPKPRLVGIKTVNPSVATIGDVLTFHIVITNEGNDFAYRVKITDEFPNILTINNTDVIVTGPPSLNWDFDHNQLEVTIDVLKDRQTIEIFINATVNNVYYGNPNLTNTVSFTYFDSLNVMYQGSASVPYSIIPPTTSPTPGGLLPLLVGEKDVNPTSAGVGEGFEFMIEVENIGDAPAFNVLITDAFPTVVTITDVSTSRGNFEIDHHQVKVRLNILDVFETVKIIIRVKVNETATTNTIFYDIAYFTYTYNNFTYAGSTNSIPYQIILETTAGLPTTGGYEKNPPSFSGYPLLLLVGAALFLLGTSTIIYKLWFTRTHHQNKAWIRSVGVVLIISGICIALVGCVQNDKRTFSSLTTPLVESENVATPSSGTPASPLPVQSSLAPSATEETLPDYPIPTPTLLPGTEKSGIAFDISPVTRIVIPSIKVDNVVKYVPFDGLSWKIAGLKREVVWMGDTSWPGLGGNTGLSAHVSLPDGSDGPFRFLVQLKKGDVVELYTEENKYIYEVQSQEVVQESDLSVLQPTDHSQITLITCTGWDVALERYLSRLVVYSDLVDIQPLEISMSSK